MLMDVPRLSAPEKLVRVEMVDRGDSGGSGTVVSTFAFDGKVVFVPYRLPAGRFHLAELRWKNDCRVLVGHDLDLERYVGW